MTDPAKEAALRPCPFCGSRVTQYSKLTAFAPPEFRRNPVAKFYCVSCGGRAGYGHGEKDAAAAWNRRAPQEAMVYCLTCCDPDGEVVHIFSTSEKRAAFAAADPRPHVFYDYVVDAPERFEGTVQ